jgi:HEAT repeat protein
MTEFLEGGAQLNGEEAGIGSLVRGLSSLTEGELSVAALVGVGERAVPALRRVLLDGQPSTVYLPRQRVVRTLAELGGFRALGEYLLRDKNIADPELRLAEEAVENTAARELARDLSDENFEILCALASRRKLPGAVEALGQFCREAAAPLLVAALESDFCRTVAVEGIRPIYKAAVPYLIECVRSPEPSRSAESPTSLRRRRAAVRLLAEQRIDATAWPVLEFLLHERDEWLQSCAAKIAFSIGKTEPALRILVSHLTSSDWVLVNEIAEFLSGHLCVAGHEIVRELASASASSNPVEAKRCRLLRWILKSEGNERIGGSRIA